MGLEVSTGSNSDRAASGPLAAARDRIASRQEQVKDVLSGEVGDEIWSLLVLAARLAESNAQAAAAAEPAVLAKFTFNLAKAFNLFYHRHRIIAEEDEVKRAVLITIADYARQQLIKALGTLGISVPERM